MPIKSQIAKRIIDEINVYLEQKDSLDSIMNLSKTGKESEKLSVDRLDNPNGYMTLLSEQVKEEMEGLAERMEYIELAETENYEKIFAESMRFV